jgi:hypothetical protein
MVPDTSAKPQTPSGTGRPFVGVSVDDSPVVVGGATVITVDVDPGSVVEEDPPLVLVEVSSVVLVDVAPVVDVDVVGGLINVGRSSVRQASSCARNATVVVGVVVDVGPPAVDVGPPVVDVVAPDVDVVPSDVDVVPAEVDVVPAEVDVVPSDVDVVPAEVEVVGADVDVVGTGAGRTAAHASSPGVGSGEPDVGGSNWVMPPLMMAAQPEVPGWSGTCSGTTTGPFCPGGPRCRWAMTGLARPKTRAV